MNQRLHKFKDDWEKYLFYVSIVFAIFSFLFFIIKIVYAEKEPTISAPSIPQLSSLLNRSAFAFLNENPNIEKVSDPFVLNKVLAKYQPKTPNKVDNNNKPQNLPPTKPKKNVNVIYTGWLDSSSGEKVAFISVVDETTKQKTSHTCSEGTKLSQFTLSKIENDYIIITDANNKEYKVKIHSNQKIQIE